MLWPDPQRRGEIHFKVAKSLQNLGYKRIRPLHGGIDAWIDAGFAVEH